MLPNGIVLTLLAAVLAWLAFWFLRRRGHTVWGALAGVVVILVYVALATLWVMEDYRRHCGDPAIAGLCYEWEGFSILFYWASGVVAGVLYLIAALVSVRLKKRP